MLAFEFMRHAFMGCFLVSLLAGSVGWFMILRRQAFAAHALPHIGFSGAAASVWLGFLPLPGMILFSLLAGMVMAQEEGTSQQEVYHAASLWRRDGITGLVLAASLGFGVLCLHETAGASNQVTTLLFGDVLGLGRQSLFLLLVVVVVCLSGLAVLWRPLLFASLAPELAEARGVPMRCVATGFMFVVALATSACAEVAGALLSFSLMIGPALAALRLGLSPVKGVLFSIGTALFLSWGSLVLSWYTDAPVSFWIGLGAVLLYATAGGYRRIIQAYHAA